MTRSIIFACGLLLILFGGGVNALEESVNTMPSGGVTTSRIASQIAETEADPGLEAEARDRLLALYRRALNNLQEAEDNRARAERFALAIRISEEQAQRIRQLAAVAMASEIPEDLGIAADTPLDQIEVQLRREQAERDAADAQRANLERQIAYQEMRPAAIRLRIAVAQEEQESTAAALQTKLPRDAQSAFEEAERWSR